MSWKLIESDSDTSIDEKKICEDESECELLLTEMGKETSFCCEDTEKMEKCGTDALLVHYGHIKNVLGGTPLRGIYLTCAPESKIHLSFKNLINLSKPTGSTLEFFSPFFTSPLPNSQSQ